MDIKEKNKNKIFSRKRVLWLIILLLLVIFVLVQNNYLTVSEYQYENEDLPEELEGYRIVQISDLHNKEYSFYPSYLTTKIEELNPDCIVITGDIVDGNHTDIAAAVEFAALTAEIAPTYYISGNHEFWLSEAERENLLMELEQAGVKVMDNEHTLLTRGGASISLLGLGDRNLTDGTLRALLEDDMVADITVLLAHEPQYLNFYAREGVDLIFTGHAHGGQIRLPFIGGLVAPDQGFFPKYTEGIHTEGGTTMIISRGIGNSIVPLRLFNYPEIVCVTLTKG